MTGQDIIEVIPRKYRPLLEQSLRGRWQALQEVRFRIGQAVEWYDGKKHRIDATRVTRMDIGKGYILYVFYFSFFDDNLSGYPYAVSSRNRQIPFSNFILKSIQGIPTHIVHHF